MNRFLLATAAAAAALAPAASAQDAPCLMSKLTPDRAQRWIQFGDAVALARETLFVGVPLENVVARNSGVVRVYRRDGLSWFLRQEILPPKSDSGEAFGMEVAAADGTLAVLSLRRAGTSNGYPRVVSAYGEDGGAWTLEAELEPIGEPYFRESIAAADGWIFAGSTGWVGGVRSGAVHAYRRTDLGWEPAGALLPQTASLSFGTRIAVDGDTLVVGGSYDDEAGSGAGAAWVFERSGATWIEIQKLTASDAAPLDAFGASLAIAGDTIAVGAPLTDHAGPDSGSVYVFVEQAGAWTETARLAAPAAEAGDGLGGALGLAGARVVASATGRGPDGAVLVFEGAAESWAPRQELRQGDTRPNKAVPDAFGSALAVAGDLAVVGAPNHDQRGPNAGAVYTYSLAGSPCATLTSPRELSWGKQRLEIDRGPEHAGHLYRLLGSMSGTSRGVPFRGTRIPLNHDAYFAALLQTPKLCPFASSLGALDGAGRATLLLAIPPEAYLQIVGLSLDHAFVERGPNGFEHVSNAVTTRFDLRK